MPLRAETSPVAPGSADGARVHGEWRVARDGGGHRVAPEVSGAGSHP